MGCSVRVASNPAVPKNPRLKGSPGKTRRARQKPTRVRYSGVSFVYQTSGIFASGLTPIIATWLLAGRRQSAVALLRLRRVRQRDQPDFDICRSRKREPRHGPGRTTEWRNRAVGPGYDVTRTAMQRPQTPSAKHIGVCPH